MTNSKKGGSNVDAKLRKHPLAPKKPRSAFIFYSQHVHNEGKVDDCDVEGLAAEKVNIRKMHPAAEAGMSACLRLPKPSLRSNGQISNLVLQLLFVSFFFFRQRFPE